MMKLNNEFNKIDTDNFRESESVGQSNKVIVSTKQNKTNS